MGLVPLRCFLTVQYPANNNCSQNAVYVIQNLVFLVGIVISICTFIYYVT